MSDTTEHRRYDKRISDEGTLERILGFERSTHDQVHAVVNQLQLMKAEQDHIKEKLDSLVSRLEFTPVKLLVYGMTSITLASVVAALIALVVNKG